MRFFAMLVILEHSALDVLEFQLDVRYLGFDIGQYLIRIPGAYILA